MIEKIILDDFDTYYQAQSSAKKKRAKTPGSNQKRPGFGERTSAVNLTNVNQSNEHLKYEIIEKILKQPPVDKDLPNKTLQEMMNLYQELLEKNLSNSSVRETGAHLGSQFNNQDSVLVNSQGSIIVLTDRNNQTLYQKVNLGSETTFQGLVHHEESILTKRRESESKIKGMRGSMQLEHNKPTFTGGSPLLKGQKRIAAQQSATTIEKNREIQAITGKVSVGKILQNSSGRNTLFLDIGKQNWSSNQILVNDASTKANGRVANKDLTNNHLLEMKNVDILSQLKDFEQATHIINESLERERESAVESKAIPLE